MFTKFDNQTFDTYFAFSALAIMRSNHQRLLERQRLGEESRDNQDNIQGTILDHIWYKRSYKQFFTRRELYRPLFFVTFLSFIQQFSGVTVIRSYVVKIFNEIGKSYFHIRSELKPSD